MGAIRCELFADRERKGELSGAVLGAALTLRTGTLSRGCEMMHRVILVEGRAQSQKHLKYIFGALKEAPNV